VTRLLLALLLALAAGGALALEPLPFRDAAEEARYRTLIAELRCVMCQSQSLADSNSMIAADLRREVLDLMQQGKTDAEIKDFLVARYTDFVLYRPPLRADTLMLWLGPGVVLLAGAIAVVVVIRRRAAAFKADQRPPADAPNSEDW
jgi:cytochrome c-type biogenesis protein CcmH